VRWQVSNPRRHSHYSCYERLQEWVRARAAGESPPALAWKPRNAGPLQLSPESRYRITRAAQARSVAAAHVAADGPHAAQYVADVVSRTSTGPTWMELAVAMGWPVKPWGTLDWLGRGLAKAGWLTFTPETRSLRPGPAAQSGAPR
jgi:hypothetical protein